MNAGFPYLSSPGSDSCVCFQNFYSLSQSWCQYYLGLQTFWFAFLGHPLPSLFMISALEKTSIGTWKTFMVRPSGTIRRHQTPLALTCRLTVLLHGQKEIWCCETYVRTRQALLLGVSPRGGKSGLPEVVGGCQCFHCSALKMKQLQVWTLLISSLRNLWKSHN